ncbi:MAG TPA: maleylpyruvate isomerase N-terminal domain-containing protein [Nocardioidaceae bacterium]
MTLGFAGSLDRSAVLQAADLVAELVARSEVAQAWTSESSCVGMSVGGLTRHLVSQPVNVVKLLRADQSDAETIPLLEHYARAAWVREDLEGDTNRSIRESADREASEGRDTALALLAQARSEIESTLADAPSTTYIPWQGWSLATDDFLVTRLMEMVVHADDLAASVAVPTPEFGTDVLDPVFRLLTAIAVRRHGQDAVVRTFARPQRAPRDVAAF